jgi:hypothetical protein
MLDEGLSCDSRRRPDRWDFRADAARRSGGFYCYLHFCRYWVDTVGGYADTVPVRRE